MGGRGHDSKHEILQAVEAAIEKHGLADLTMQAIADETHLSTAALHYHYDTKEDLLVAFLQHNNERLKERFLTYADGDPVSRLWDVFDEHLDHIVAEGSAGMNAGYIELHAQAAHNERFREVLAEGDEFVRSVLAAIIEEGIEDGIFRPLDSWATATLLLAIADSAGLHVLTLDNDDVTDDFRWALRELVLPAMLAEDETLEAHGIE